MKNPEWLMVFMCWLMAMIFAAAAILEGNAWTFIPATLWMISAFLWIPNED